MKVGIFSDLQLHNYREFGKPVGMGLNTRAVFGLDILRQITDVAIKEKLSAVLFCGDFFELRGYLLTPLVCAAQTYLNDLANEVQVIMIAGNHDQSTMEPDSPQAVKVFKHIPNVSFASERPTWIMSKKDMRKGGRVACLAVYGFNSGASLESLVETETPVPKILLLHQTLNGTKMNPEGIKAEEGMTVPQLKQYMKKNKVRKCFVGDIHYRQRLDRDIWYVGNCLQRQFGEEQEKGMLILDTQTWSTKFWPLESPQFITAWKRKSGPQINFPFTRDDYNYVRVYTDKQQVYEELTALGKPNFRVIPPPKEFAKSRSPINLRMTHDQAIEKFVALRAKGKVRQKRLIKLGKGFVNPN